MATDPPLNILIAEDNDINKVLIRAVFRAIVPGANIFLAANGEEAVNSYHSQKPDIIFMDIHMPLMDGCEATRIIRKDKNAQLPIIALSAASSREERQSCLDAGMNDCLSKPVNREAIAALIAHWFPNR